MAKGKTDEKNIQARLIDILTITPAIVGMVLAALMFVVQFFKWWLTGKWDNMPVAGFVPQGLVEWAVADTGGLLGLKKVFLSLLSFHISVWFFIVGWLCTIMIHELTKGWRREKP